MKLLGVSTHEFLRVGLTAVAFILVLKLIVAKTGPDGLRDLVGAI